MFSGKKKERHFYEAESPLKLERCIYRIRSLEAYFLLKYEKKQTVEDECHGTE